MNRNRVIQLVTVMVAIGCLAATTFWGVPRINKEREALQLVNASPTADTPAGVSFMVTLAGPLRGLLINHLWMRIEELKQEGKFFEINELARTVTALQPRQPDVWQFHAWNMAYNVSVQTYTPEERWDWVNKGIRLLREQGLVYNPKAVKLYRELTWIFFHKFGQYSDDMHWYYKRRLAREWGELLGAPPANESKEEAIIRFGSITLAPETLEELIEKVPTVRALLDEHFKPAGYDIEAGFDKERSKAREKLLRAIGTVLLYHYTNDFALLPKQIREKQFYDNNITATLQDRENHPALKALMSYLRNRVLRDNYNMSPRMMLGMMVEFGPLDFRHSSAHGMYWADRGVKVMDSLLDTRGIDRVNTIRQRIHTPQDMFQNGRLWYDPYTDVLTQEPDLRFIETYEKALVLGMADLRANQKGVLDTYEAGHENFLLQAMMFHYMYGNKDDAANYYKKVITLYKNREHNIRTKRYLLTLDELVTREFLGNAINMENTSAYVHGHIRQAMWARVAGNSEEYVSRIRRARSAIEQYEQTQGNATPIAPQNRMSFPPFEYVWADTLNRMLLTPYRIEMRRKLWANTPEQIQRILFDKVKPMLYTLATDAGYDAAKMFPEPEGIEKYRADLKRRMELQKQQQQQRQQDASKGKTGVQ